MNHFFLLGSCSSAVLQKADQARKAKDRNEAVAVIINRGRKNPTNSFSFFRLFQIKQEKQRRLLSRLEQHNELMGESPYPKQYVNKKVFQQTVKLRGAHGTFSSSNSAKLRD